MVIGSYYTVKDPSKYPTRRTRSKVRVRIFESCFYCPQAPKAIPITPDKFELNRSMQHHLSRSSHSQDDPLPSPGFGLPQQSGLRHTRQRGTLNVRGQLERSIIVALFAVS